MKRRLSLLVCAVLIVLSFAVVQTPAKADSATVTAKVTAAQLRIRVSASLRAKVVETVKRGTMLTILGRNKGMTWVKVQAADGNTGWVSVFWVRLQGTARLKTLPIVS